MKTGWTRRPRHRGSVLVEFVFVALILYGLLAMILTFGQFYFTSQVIESAADTAAREISETALPATITFEDALEDARVKDRIYDEDYLVIDISAWVANPMGRTLYEYIDQVVDPPVVNKALYPVMVRQEVNGMSVFRYPGALVTKAGAPTGLTVEVPVVVGRDLAGVETIKWTKVIEEIDTEEDAADNTPPSPDSFPVNSPARGMVALRMNFPYESASMSGGDPKWNEADDSAVTELNSPSGALVSPTNSVGPYTGTYGLGSQFAMRRTVRPYRHLFTAQAIYRREVFE